MSLPAIILPQTALRELLYELLSEPELRMLLFDIYGHSVVSALPMGVATSELFFAAVDVLDRRGLVGAELFHRLGLVAPGKIDRIKQVATRWGFGEPEPHDPRVALIERLHAAIKAGDWVGSLLHVHEHQAAFFPSTVADEQGWVTTYSSQVITEESLLTVEALRMRDWASGAVRTTAHALLGDQVPLLRPVAGGAERWVLAEAAIGAIERCLAATRPRISPVEFGGRVSIYLGGRSQLDSHTKLATWSAAKEAYAPRGVLLRTIEGFIDQMATQALGDRWFRLVPPESPLRRAP